MDEEATSSLRSHLCIERRHCPHCSKFVSLKTYKAHKRVYYDSDSDLWQTDGAETTQSAREESPPLSESDATTTFPILDDCGGIQDLLYTYTCVALQDGSLVPMPKKKKGPGFSLTIKRCASSKRAAIELVRKKKIVHTSQSITRGSLGFHCTPNFLLEL